MLHMCGICGHIYDYGREIKVAVWWGIRLVCAVMWHQHIAFIIRSHDQKSKLHFIWITFTPGVASVPFIMLLASHNVGCQYHWCHMTKKGMYLISVVLTKGMQWCHWQHCWHRDVILVPMVSMTRKVMLHVISVIIDMRNGMVQFMIWSASHLRKAVTPLMLLLVSCDTDASDYGIKLPERHVTSHFDFLGERNLMVPLMLLTPMQRHHMTPLPMPPCDAKLMSQVRHDMIKSYVVPHCSCLNWGMHWCCWWYCCHVVTLIAK